MQAPACYIEDKCFYILSTRYIPERFILYGRAELKIQDGENW